MNEVTYSGLNYLQIIRGNDISKQKYEISPLFPFIIDFPHSPYIYKFNDYFVNSNGVRYPYRISDENNTATTFDKIIQISK